MRLDPAPALAAPAVVADDPFAPPPPRGGRRLKALDFLVAAVVVAAGGAVAANALVMQVPPPHAALPQPGSSGVAAGNDKAKTVRSTSIPLPPVNPNARGAAVAGGATNGTLGYLASKTSVTGMTPPLKPVSAEEAAAGAIAAPRPVASLRPPLKTGALDATGPISLSPAGAGSVDPLPIRPPADVPSSPRVLAVQRALAKLGYGPLKVNGAMSAETRQAIQRFERDRKLPADGEVSDRLMRELGAVSGLAIN